MSQRILGYLSNDNSLTAPALRQVDGEVELDTTSSSGLGMSFIQQERVLERKSPQLTGGVHDVFGRLAEVSTRVLVACVQEEILTNTRHMSPHRFQGWMYAEGMIDADEMREDGALLRERFEALPDFLQRSVEASSPASVRFFDCMYELFQHDIYHVAEHRRRAAAEAFARSVRRVHKNLDEPFHALLASQKNMMAAALGEPLYYRTFKGIEQPAPPPLYDGERTRPIKSPHFRAFIVASLDGADPKHWSRLEPGHVLYLEDGWGCQTVAI